MTKPLTEKNIIRIHCITFKRQYCIYYSGLCGLYEPPNLIKHKQHTTIMKLKPLQPRTRHTKHALLADKENKKTLNFTKGL